MLCSILSLRAQTFVKPAVKVKDTSFAVITDKGTFQACEAELKAYQEILGMEGLPTFIVYKDRKSTRLNSSHPNPSRMPSSA